ncbi:hypothetical protein DFJ43DRAFT_1067312 [Lentinula guzmanii]|uniref:Uncharacterized protein n=1 Tax=Lentinula guzmanii TaxID=2804957 RepID=A0AA38JBG0_9AGAR|nr:hypothetical protein DFJ43DRAFT_1067312 [Lentinula guzmanii]
MSLMAVCNLVNVLGIQAPTALVAQKASMMMLNGGRNSEGTFAACWTDPALSLDCQKEFPSIARKDHMQNFKSTSTVP